MRGEAMVTAGAVAQALRGLGYSVREHPRLGLFRVYTPDILVRHRGKTLAIELKTRPVTLNDVARVRTLPVDKVIICVPAKVMADIAESVVAYASNANVGLCQADNMESIVASLRGAVNW